MKKYLLGVGALFLASLVHAGADRGVTVDPVYESYGNNWRPINVTESTSTVTLISSAAVDASLGINAWRFREIINTSNGGLILFPNATTYSTYSSTFSVVLASGPNGAGDSWKVPGESAVYGLWSSATTSGGAGGSEHYWHP